MFCGSLLELSCIEICKMEANMEASVLELYYSSKFCIRKYKKESVCTNVAIKSKEKRLLFVKNNPYESLKTHRDVSFNK